MPLDALVAVPGFGFRVSRLFFTLVTGPRRSLSLKLSDTRVCEPQIRARLGMVSGFGSRVSGFGYRVSGVVVSGFGFRVPGAGFRVSRFRVFG